MQHLSAAFCTSFLEELIGFRCLGKVSASCSPSSEESLNKHDSAFLPSFPTNSFIPFQTPHLVVKRSTTMTLLDQRKLLFKQSSLELCLNQKLSSASRFFPWQLSASSPRRVPAGMYQLDGITHPGK